MITTQDIEQWCVERFEEVREEGTLSVVSLIHYAAAGTETEVHSANCKLPADKWTAAAVASVCESIASRFAKGLPGVQQFALVALYGASTKPSSTLPFQRVGALTYGAAPGGGLATEAATPTGMAATAQRWGELAIQGATQKDLAVTGALAKLVENLAANNQTLLERNMDFALAVQKLLGDQQAAKAEAAVRVVTARRNAELAQQAFRLLPAGVNGIMGANIFPEASAGNSVLRSLAKVLNREQIEHLAGLAQGDLPNQMALAGLMDQLSSIRQQDEKEEARFRELAEGLDLDPEAEMSGDADPRARELDVAGGTEPRQLANGHTNGHANGGSGHTTKSEGDVMLDELLEAAGGKLPLLLHTLAGERPELAAKLKARAKQNGKE